MRNTVNCLATVQEPVFPLLTKILDANDWLSVQVHPDDAYGLEHEGELGKTECWYIISADEGSEIIYGHNAKSKEELRQQIEDKNWDDLLTKVPVKAGDFFYVPSGTMHAIGAGILMKTPWKTRTFPSLAFPSSFHQSNYHHRGLYRPIYVNTKKGLENISQVFFFLWMANNQF